MASNNNNVWKWICGLLTAIILTGATTFFTFGYSTGKAIAILETHQSHLTALSESNVDLIKANQKNVELLTKVISELKTQNALQQAAIDANTRRIQQMKED